MAGCSNLVVVSSNFSCNQLQLPEVPELLELLRWGKNNQLQLLKVFEKNGCGKKIVAILAVVTD